MKFLAKYVAVALIKRFDRGPRGERIPYLSAASLLGIEDSHQVHTYTEIVDALKRYSPDVRPQKVMATDTR